jgi:hypothetical protein
VAHVAPIDEEAYIHAAYVGAVVAGAVAEAPVVSVLRAPVFQFADTHEGALVSGRDYLRERPAIGPSANTLLRRVKSGL